MNDILIGFLFLCIGIIVIIILIFRPPKSEFPGMPTLQGIIGGVGAIIMGILLIIGKMKL